MKLHDWQANMTKKKRPSPTYKSLDRWSPASPNPDAVARVLNPLPIPTKCHLCGGTHITLETNSVVYNGKTYGDWPFVYLCNDCRSYVGMHPETNIPLGTLADEDTRQARKLSKDPFEKLWRSGKLTRSQAYKALADFFQIDKEECHFGWFTAEMCYEARDWAIEKQKELGIHTPTITDEL